MQSTIVINQFPRWLKIKEASIYSSIGVKRLKELALKKKIRAFKDQDIKTNAWVFDRLSIDEYRLAQINIDAKNTQIAKDILNSL